MKLNFFRKISISLIIGCGFPIIVNAGVESEIHKMCLSAADYMGCVELNSYKSYLPECNFGLSEEEAALEVILDPLSAISKLITLDDACQGNSVLENGDKYIGEFLNGWQHGQGTYISANGDKYVGDWIQGEMTGQGTYTSANGKEYIGEFLNGELISQGEFTGVGIQLDKDKDSDYLIIVSPIEDTPAYDAGIKAKDKLISIDDISTEGMNIEDAIKLIRGKEGTEVKLEIL